MSHRHYFETAADVGNYHAGFSGSIIGIPIGMQLSGAGAYELKKNIGDGEYWKLLSGLASYQDYRGDRPADHYWNLKGAQEGKMIYPAYRSILGIHPPSWEKEGIGW